MAEHRPPRRPRSTGNPDEYRSPMAGRASGNAGAHDPHRDASVPGHTGDPDQYRSPMAAGRTQELVERHIPVIEDEEEAAEAGEPAGPPPAVAVDPDAYRSPMGTGRAFGAGGYRGPMVAGRGGRGREYRSPMTAGRLGNAGEYRSPMSSGRAPEGRAGRQGPARPRPAQKKREMFPITCAACSKEAEVPFKPAEGREVLCQDCFRARKQS